MKIRDIERYKPVLTALKKAGFKVVEVVKQEKKTIITVSACETMCSAKGGKT
jgi:hypothetical protein